jgi:hypothetical protein
VKEMENEILTLRLKIRQHEELEEHQLQQMEEVTTMYKERTSITNLIFESTNQSSNVMLKLPINNTTN